MCFNFFREIQSQKRYKPCLNNVVGDPIIKMERVGIPLSLTPPHFGACSKPGLGIPLPYVIIFFVFNS